MKQIDPRNIKALALDLDGTILWPDAIGVSAETALYSIGGAALGGGWPQARICLN
ncbi:MAG: hypothetical protein LBS06_01045 [Treponema sp.]|jgi:hypothetical protein|nr:hypothetical protein [Treponema sp.]